MGLFTNFEIKNMGEDSDKQQFTHNTHFWFSLWMYSFAMKNQDPHFSLCLTDIQLKWCFTSKKNTEEETWLETATEKQSKL